MKEWTLLGEGRNRLVFRRGNYVVKVPLNEAGLHDNWHEAFAFRHWKQSSFIHMARCRSINGLLVMEFARYPGPLSDPDGWIPFNKLPEWAWNVDCQQVGYNRRGEIVAYDYGLM